MPVLEEFIHATRMSKIVHRSLDSPAHIKIATAELEPITENYVQSDEGL